MKFWEGAILSLTAFLLGYLAGLCARLLSVGRPSSSPCSRAGRCSTRTSGLIPFVDGLQVATLFFFTVFPYTVATLVPIWRAAVTDPDAVMRG